MKTIYSDLESQYGKNITLTVVFKGNLKLDTKNVEELSDTFNEKISEAYDVEYELTTKGDNNKDTSNLTLTVGKVGSKWYLIRDFASMFQAD